jgi:hypothetical protein
MAHADDIYGDRTAEGGCAGKDLACWRGYKGFMSRNFKVDRSSVEDQPADSSAAAAAAAVVHAAELPGNYF